VVSIEKYERLTAKVTWADRHIHYLEGLCDAFAKSDPYRVERELDSKAHLFVYYLREIKRVPQDIQLLSGDILNNLRSALDHTACEFIGSGAGAKRIYFPIVGSLMKYQSPKFSRQIQHLGKPFIDILDQIKPYNGGNDLLWKLKELNNLDKHRLLLTVASVNPARTETFGEWEKARNDWTREHPTLPFHVPENTRRFIKTSAPGKPLKAGNELLRVSDSETNEKPELIVDVAIDESGIAEGELLVPTLKEISNMVRIVIGKFC